MEVPRNRIIPLHRIRQAAWPQADQPRGFLALRAFEDEGKAKQLQHDHPLIAQAGEAACLLTQFINAELVSHRDHRLPPLRSPVQRAATTSR